MERYCNHSLTEKSKKRFSENIEHPKDLAQLMRQAAKKKTFDIKDMNREGFMDVLLFRKVFFNTGKLLNVEIV
jgi:hypothetical protein